MERVHWVSLKRQKQKHQIGLFEASTLSPSVGEASPQTTQQAPKLNIEELRDEEIVSMDNNDKQAEDISNAILRSAGSPKIEPNPERFQSPQKTVSRNKIPLGLELENKLMTQRKAFSEETAHMISDLISYGNSHESLQDFSPR